MYVRSVAIALTIGALAACGGYDEPNAPEAPTSRTVAMRAVGGNGVVGAATIIAANASTSTVTVSLEGMPPNTQHAGHVHRGSCAEQGPIDQGLNPITADAAGRGSATTTGVRNELLQAGYYFQYHVQLEPPGDAISCGDIATSQQEEGDPNGPGY
ncbi:MAG TPA: hypothetical protein VFY16_06480 [Gemmatimonadaceae bacterium]|nr:hypothetical protein [Gemmatimonadaceae bacterium]